MPVMTVAKQAADYGGFYVPRFEVKASGSALSAGVVRDITQVTYRDNIKEIDSFEITVGNWDARTRKFKYIGAEDSASLSASAPASANNQLYKLFEPYAHDFTLSLGYSDKLKQMTT